MHQAIGGPHPAGAERPTLLDVHAHLPPGAGHMDGHTRRAGLFVPAAELLQVLAGGSLHGGQPFLAGHGLAVMPVEIQVRAAAIALRTQQRMQHADHLGALVVDGRRVEIGDLDIVIRPDGMRQWAGILRELHGPQTAHVIDAPHGRRALVGRELLVAEDRQAFLQAELEPIPARDAIAGPVVEIFMRHHAGDAIKILVGSGFGVSENVFGIEDVEALVLHRPGVEITHRNDVELVKIILAAIDLLVPGHAGLEGGHGMGAARHIGFRCPYRQLHTPAANGGELVSQRRQITGHQCEEIAGLGPGVRPGDGVAAIGQRHLRTAVAIGEQHRVARGIGLEPYRVRGEHIRTIREPGDAAEALGFALCHQPALRGIKTHQPRVGSRRDLDQRFHFGGIAWDGEAERLAAGFDILRHAIDEDGKRAQILTIEHQRAIMAAIAAHLELCPHLGRGAIQIE